MMTTMNPQSIMNYSGDAVLGLIGTIGGTLLGTVLGFALNAFSNRGKIKILSSNCTHETTTVVSRGSKSMCCTFRISIEVYNSSNTSKIIRDIKIAFCNRKKLILSVAPGDLDRPGKSAIALNTKAENIPANQVKVFDLMHELNGQEMQNVVNANRIYLLFRTEGKRIKRKLIRELDFRGLMNTAMEER